MRTRLLTTGLLLLNLAACSKEQEKKAETPPPAPASAPAQPQTPPPGTPTGSDAQTSNTGTPAHSPEAQANTGTQAPASEPAAPATGGKEHAATPVPRTRPPAENPGPWQKKALDGQELYATLDTNQGTVVVKLFSKES